MASFADAYEFVALWEGGFIDHPSDPGGMTIGGIARRYNPHWAGWGIVDEILASGRKPSPNHDLLKPLIIKTYRARYWEPVQADLVQQPIDLLMFDAAVQHGPKAAIRMAQRACRVTDDGKIGPITSRALRNLGPGNIEEMLAQRVRWYLDSAAKRGKRMGMKHATAFNLGWGRRIAALAAKTLRTTQWKN
jgi:lysozyme family protein